MVNLRCCVLLFVLFTSASLASTNNARLYNCDKNRTNEIMCLSCNIYHEARAESPAGQLAVALVTMGRVKSDLYPNTFCDVTWEARVDRNTNKPVAMFSWTRDGKHDLVFNEPQWGIAIAIASQILNTHIENKPYRDITFGSLWYHHIDISPYWAPHYYPTVQIGNHQFYAANEETFLHELSRTGFDNITEQIIFNIQTQSQ